MIVGSSAHGLVKPISICCSDSVPFLLSRPVKNPSSPFLNSPSSSFVPLILHCLWVMTLADMPSGDYFGPRFPLNSCTRGISISFLRKNKGRSLEIFDQILVIEIEIYDSKTQLYTILRQIFFFVKPIRDWFCSDCCSFSQHLPFHLYFPLAAIRAKVSDNDDSRKIIIHLCWYYNHHSLRHSRFCINAHVKNLPILFVISHFLGTSLIDLRFTSILIRISFH